MVLHKRYPEDKFDQDFGIKVCSDLVSVPARMLPPPMLRYHDSGREKTCAPSVGQWNMINKAFYPRSLVDIRSATANNIENALRDLHRRTTDILQATCQRPQPQQREQSVHKIQLFIRLFGERLSCQLDKTSSLGSEIKSTLAKHKLQIEDYFVYHQLRVLDIRKTLLELNVQSNGTLHITPRTRGGCDPPAQVSFITIPFDERMASIPYDELFEEKQAAQALWLGHSTVKPGRTKVGEEHLLAEKGRNTFHGLFRMVYRNHANKFSLGGNFTYEHIRYVPALDEFIFDPSYLNAHRVGFSPEGFEADIVSLASVLDRVCQPFRVKHTQFYPAYVAHLLDTMRNLPVNAKHSDTFKSYLRNHMCTLSQSARTAQVLLVFGFIRYQGYHYRSTIPGANSGSVNWSIALAKTCGIMRTVFQNGIYRTKSWLSLFEYMRHLISHAADDIQPTFTVEDADLCFLVFWEDFLPDFLCRLILDFWTKSSYNPLELFHMDRLERPIPVMWHEHTQLRDNPVVYFDIRIGRNRIGRIRMELFKDITPRTSENFRQFCVGRIRDGFYEGYKGSSIFEVCHGLFISGGDFIANDGSGNTSIYAGKPFMDENFIAKHTGPGILSMRDFDHHNGSQFQISCAAAPTRDNWHVVLGKCSMMPA